MGGGEAPPSPMLTLYLLRAGSHGVPRSVYVWQTSFDVQLQIQSVTWCFQKQKWTSRDICVLFLKCHMNVTCLIVFVISIYEVSIDMWFSVLYQSDYMSHSKSCLSIDVHFNVCQFLRVKCHKLAKTLSKIDIMVPSFTRLASPNTEGKSPDFWASRPTFFREYFEYRSVGFRQLEIVAYVATKKHVYLVYIDENNLIIFHALVMYGGICSGRGGALKFRNLALIGGCLWLISEASMLASKGHIQRPWITRLSWAYEV